MISIETNDKATVAMNHNTEVQGSPLPDAQSDSCRAEVNIPDQNLWWM